MGTLEGPVVAMYREGGRSPAGIGGMAVIAISGYPDGDMVRVGSGIVCGLMTRIASIRRSGVIPVVALVAIRNVGMSPGKRVIVIVDRECRRGPAGSGSMAVFAVVRYSDSYVVGVRSGIVSALMTIKTRIGSSCVISIMALIAISDVGVGPR
jgi:hypothetical protein